MAPKRKNIEESEVPRAKRRTLTDLLREKEGCISESVKSDDSSDNEEFSDSDNASDHSGNDEDNELFSNSDSNSDNDNEKGDDEHENTTEKKSKSKVWEDIYGRFRDEKGNVIKNTEPQKYVPPSLRKSSSNDQKQEELLKIKRNLKGLLNR